MSLYFLYCVRYLVFCFFCFVLFYLFGCYHFLMNKDICIFTYPQLFIIFYYYTYAEKNYADVVVLTLCT